MTGKPIPFAAIVFLLAGSPLGAQQRWTLTPELRIGSLDDPATALSPVSHIAVGEGGRLYVSQRQQKQIRIYSAEGELLRIIGGDGAGPGEFRDISRLFWRGDTLQVLDFGQQRFSLFTADGEFIRTFRPLPRGAIVRHLVAAEFPDGSIYARPRGSGPDAPSPLLRITGPAAPDTLGWVSGLIPPSVTIPFGGGVITSFFPPALWPADRVATDDRVRTLTLVIQPKPGDADSAFFRVRRISYAGEALFEGRFRYRPRPITAEDLREAFARRGSLSPQAARRRATELREAFREKGVLDPEFHAPVQSLLAGRDGTTWLQLSAADPDRHQWMVLDTNGELLARLSVPASLRILNADRHYAWGVETDELDVPYLVRYAVVDGALPGERR